MGTLTVLALRVVIALALAGSVFVQIVMVPLIWADLDESELTQAARISFVAIAILGIATMQVIAVCVWKLLTMVRRGTVFSHAAFRYVDIVIGALAAASLLAFALGVVFAPGEAVPPGMVLLIGGSAVVIAGVGLVVLVQRMLLAQAVARDVEAQHLQAELNEVI